MSLKNIKFFVIVIALVCLASSETFATVIFHWDYDGFSASLKKRTEALVLQVAAKYKNSKYADRGVVDFARGPTVYEFVFTADQEQADFYPGVDTGASHGIFLVNPSLVYKQNELRVSCFHMFSHAYDNQVMKGSNEELTEKETESRANMKTNKYIDEIRHYLTDKEYKNFRSSP